MTLQLLGRTSSCNVQKVIWFCEEASITYENKFYGGKHGGTKDDFFKSLNPNSTVPVIDDNGFVLYESNAIIRYLSNKNKFLQLDNYEDVALCYQWMDWASFTLAAPCAIVTLNTMVLPEDKRDSDKVSKSKLQVLSLLKILDNHLLNNDFIVGGHFSLADIPAGCWYNRCLNFDLDLSKFQGLNSWGLRLSDRKAFQKAIINAPLPPH